jgi:hypothetical protein
MSDTEGVVNAENIKIALNENEKDEDDREIIPPKFEDGLTNQIETFEYEIIGEKIKGDDLHDVYIGQNKNGDEFILKRFEKSKLTDV